MQGPDPGISRGALFSARTPATPAASGPKRTDAPKFEDSLSQARDRTERGQRPGRPSPVEDRSRDDSAVRIEERERTSGPMERTNESRNVERNPDDRVNSDSSDEWLIAEPGLQEPETVEVVPAGTEHWMDVAGNMQALEAEVPRPGGLDPEEATEAALFHIQPWPLSRTTDAPRQQRPTQEPVVGVEGAELPISNLRSGGIASDSIPDRQSNVLTGVVTPAAVSPHIGKVSEATRLLNTDPVETLPLTAEGESEQIANDIVRATAVAEPVALTTDQIVPAETTAVSQQADHGWRSEHPQSLERRARISPAQPRGQQISSTRQAEPLLLQHLESEQRPVPTQMPESDMELRPAPIMRRQVVPEPVVEGPAIETPNGVEPAAVEDSAGSLAGPAKLTRAAVGAGDSLRTPADRPVHGSFPVSHPDRNAVTVSSRVMGATGTGRGALAGSLVAASGVISIAEEGGEGVSSENTVQENAQAFSSLLQAQVTHTSRSRGVSQQIDLNPTQPTEVPGEIVARARTLADNETTELEIQLDPPELGQLKIQLRRTNGEVAARITVTDPAAFELLQQELQDLRQSLGQSDVPFASVDVEQDQRQGRETLDREQHESRHRDGPEPPLRDAHVPSPTSTQQTIDIRV